jgi:hypothetical protein
LLPVTLIYVCVENFIDRVAFFQDPDNLIFTLMAEIVVGSTAGSVMIHGMYQQYYQQKCDLIKALIESSSKFVQSFFYMSIIFLPFIISDMVFKNITIQTLWFDVSMFLLGSAFFILSLMLICYTCIAQVLIVNNNLNAIQAIVMSFKMVKGNFSKLAVPILLSLTYIFLEVIFHKTLLSVILQFMILPFLFALTIVIYHELANHYKNRCLN